jgi:carboxylesterase type B
MQPATEFAHWEGLRNVTEYASDCMQLEFNIDPDKMTNVIGSEDCLYLNIFMPKVKST